jgi:hypothetical protein
MLIELRDYVNCKKLVIALFANKTKIIIELLSQSATRAVCKDSIVFLVLKFPVLIIFPFSIVIIDTDNF